MVKKSAFTLIELIFAIVVIAITVVSLPMMNQSIAKGIDANLVQEAIFAAATKLNESTASYWDENSMEPNELNGLARVIDDGTCQKNLALTTARQKPGHINQTLHRRCLDDKDKRADDGANTTNLVDDINDLAVTNQAITTTDTTSQEGHKKLYRISITIKRGVDFGNTAKNQNIKLISVNVSDKKGNLITSLKTYSANIGEVDYYKRTF